MPDRWVALLRGINVGGNNPVNMKDLVRSLTATGYSDVRTYINSGNVVFGSTQPPTEADLEAILDERFGFPIPVLLRDRAAYADTVASAPPEFADPGLRCDVMFLKDTTTPEAALAALPPLTEGVDQIWPGPRALYFARVAAQANRTRITRIVGTPIYREMSVRNWNTTRRLLDLLDA